ncbi:PQ-loop-domain-containing protein [Hypoxylon fragiforme]|uniref:PQ-loop-domain-containing protein n=1 Tax=Hypoxylon fragiforme TaxID=63214 RepID=UPI0020C7199C|nr:PQ-loop-domain-containing protein [Hypoxylon fragiforme]KAI2605163.1 PQ-loop-domain-containing protein [Hypoxylon fragiforme]
MALSHALSVNEILSGVFGSISLTAWICLLLPQLITNFKAKSADGLSMIFLAVWLFGDITNLSGALVTGLAPTATALAGYFCISDVILISQSLYYNTINARKARQRTRSTESDASEDEPLLQPRRRSSSGLPGSHRRHSFHRQESGFDPIKRIVTGEDETPDSNPWFHNTLSVVAVYIVGAAGWFISYQAGAWDKPEAPEEPSIDTPAAVGGMVLGYASALCYLCARIPQILKNHREKSCEGLALLFFLLSLTGNLTYGLSIFSYSLEPEYIAKALPWILGSLGTIVEDCIIFYQFRLYSKSGDAKINHGDGTA